MLAEECDEEDVSPPEDWPENLWVVHTKGTWDHRCFEIAVLRRDNNFGRDSYGWWDLDEKILIAHRGAPYGQSVMRKMDRDYWDDMVGRAMALCRFLNEKEFDLSIAPIDPPPKSATSVSLAELGDVEWLKRHKKGKADAD